MPKGDEPNAVTLMVPSTDPEKKEDDTPKHDKGKEPEFGNKDGKDEAEIVRRYWSVLTSSPRRTSSSRRNWRCSLSV